MSKDYYELKSIVDQYVQAAKDVNGARLIEELKRFLPSGAEVLELGSGPGSDWEILARDYRVIGSDLSPAFLEHLREKYPQGKFLEMDAVTLETEATFDAIYSNKVLHFLKDEELDQSIKRQSEILNPNGIACHSFWKGEGTEDFNGMWVNNHLEEELNTMFGAYFDRLHLSIYGEFEEGDSILLIGRKRV